jgi:hypothetical protein
MIIYLVMLFVILYWLRYYESVETFISLFDSLTATIQIFFGLMLSPSQIRVGTQYIIKEIFNTTTKKNEFHVIRLETEGGSRDCLVLR